MAGATGDASPTGVRPPVIRLYEGEVFIDEFAGGGGTSAGIEMALGRPPDVAINHDTEALAMHARNHPRTRHILTDVYAISPEVASQGQPVGAAWFSPDCTEFSKAKGSKPFRDPRRARRTRGLAWVVVKWAEAPEPVRPRVIFVENVEEFIKWGAIDQNGKPVPRKVGRNFKRWVARLRKAGYVVDWRELRASHFGAPTSRKRLFVIARRDGRPIQWPRQTHGPTSAAPFRTAAECLDFSLPVPSIFLNKRQARTWAHAHGTGVPKRPLATATLRRIARGVKRFVLDAPEPFIVKYHGGERGDDRAQSLHEPIRTLDTSNRFALITPFMAPVRHQGDDRVHSLLEPVRTIPASDCEVALVAPTLIQTGYGERKGQLPRSLDLFEPLGTIVGCGQRHALVAAFLAKHNGGHEATGQRLSTPADTITTVDQKALVTSHLLKLRGNDGHLVTGQDVREPISTITAGGLHMAEVRAFLVKFYGSKKDGIQLQFPLDTITTKDRFGLVTVMIAGEEYVIVDIGMRMLTPRELFRCQGFPTAYHIEDGLHPTLHIPMRFTKKTQTRLVGNSVPPHLAAALISANFAEAFEAIA